MLNHIYKLSDKYVFIWYGHFILLCNFKDYKERRRKMDYSTYQYLRIWYCCVNLYFLNSGELRKQFQFHDNLQINVKTWKRQIQSESSKKVVFIGVHCRRTDYEQHIKVVSGATLVDHHFFDTAFDIYRRKYNDDYNQVIFLAVSDDNTWIKVGKYFVLYLIHQYSKSPVWPKWICPFKLE